MDVLATKYPVDTKLVLAVFVGASAAKLGVDLLSTGDVLSRGLEQAAAVAIADTLYRMWK